MSLLWMDGFEHYVASGVSASAMTGAYNSIGTAVTIGTMPVLGGKGIIPWQTSDSTGRMRWALPSTKTTGKIGVGLHFYFGTNNINDSRELIGLYSSGGTRLFDLFVNYSTNVLTIRPTNAATVYAVKTLSRSTLYHIEIQVNIGGSGSGSVEVRIDGVTEYTLGSLTNNATAYGLVSFGGGISGGNGSNNSYMDNLYIYDEAGSVNNNWLGEMQVYTLLPNADTSDYDWALSTGSSGYTLIDNIPAVNTSYIEGATPGDVSKFNIENLPTTSLYIAGIQLSTAAFKSVSGAITMEHGVEINAADNMAATGTLIQTNQTYHSRVIEYSPDTSALWTPTEINNLLLVYERT